MEIVKHPSRKGVYEMSDPTQSSFAAPRWTIEPYFRAAQRGPADQVRDGWTLIDGITGDRRRFDTKADAQRYADARHQTEMDVLVRDDATGWFLSPGPFGATLCITVASKNGTSFSRDGRPALELVHTDGTEESLVRTLRYFDLTGLEAWK